MYDMCSDPPLLFLAQAILAQAIWAQAFQWLSRDTLGSLPLAASMVRRRSPLGRSPDQFGTLSRSQVRNRQRKHTRQCLLRALAFSMSPPSLADCGNPIVATDLERFRQHMYDKSNDDNFGVYGEGNYTTQQVMAETVPIQTWQCEWQDEWTEWTDNGNFGDKGNGGNYTTQQFWAETVPIQTWSSQLGQHSDRGSAAAKYTHTPGDGTEPPWCAIEVDWDSFVFTVPRQSACGDDLQDTILKYIDTNDHALLSGGQNEQDARSDASENSDMSVAPSGRFLYRSEADEAELGADFGESCSSGEGEGKSRKDTDIDTDIDNTPRSPSCQKSTIEESENNRSEEFGMHSFSATPDLLACRTACLVSYMQATDAIIDKYKVQVKRIAAHGHSYSAKETHLLQSERRLRSSKLQLVASRRLPSFVQQILASHEASKAENNKPG